MRTEFAKPMVELLIAFQRPGQRAPPKAPVLLEGGGLAEPDDVALEKGEGALILVLHQLSISGKDWSAPLAWKTGDPGLPSDSPVNWAGAMMNIVRENTRPGPMWDSLTGLKHEFPGRATLCCTYGNVPRVERCCILLGMRQHDLCVADLFCLGKDHFRGLPLLNIGDNNEGCHSKQLVVWFNGTQSQNLFASENLSTILLTIS